MYKSGRFLFLSCILLLLFVMCFGCNLQITTENHYDAANPHDVAYFRYLTFSNESISTQNGISTLSLQVGNGYPGTLTGYFAADVYLEDAVVGSVTLSLPSEERSSIIAGTFGYEITEYDYIAYRNIDIHPLGG